MFIYKTPDRTCKSRSSFRVQCTALIYKLQLYTTVFRGYHPLSCSSSYHKTTIWSLRSSGTWWWVTGLFVPCVARRRVGLIINGNKVPEEIIPRPYGYKNIKYILITRSQRLKLVNPQPHNPVYIHTHFVYDQFQFVQYNPTKCTFYKLII